MLMAVITIHMVRGEMIYKPKTGKSQLYIGKYLQSLFSQNLHIRMGSSTTLPCLVGVTWVFALQGLYVRKNIQRL